MKALPVILLALSVLLPSSPSLAEDHAQKVLSFAEELRLEGDYYRAIGEYKRVLFAEKDAASPLAIKARLGMAAAMAGAGEYQGASDLLRDMAQGDRPEAPAAQMELGKVYYLAGAWKLAAESFDTFVQRFPGHPLAGEARYLAGWSRLQGGDYPQAAQDFQALDGLFPCAPELAQWAESPPALPRKELIVAGLLSAVVPGSGHLYCGQPKRALSSFVLTGLSIFGSYAAWRNDYKGAGTIVSFVALTAWGGGIRSAVRCARDRNESERKGALSRLAERCGVSVTPQGLTVSY